MPLNLTLPPRVPGARDWCDRSGAAAEAPIAHTIASELPAPAVPVTAAASFWDEITTDLNADLGEGAVIGRSEVP